MAEEGINISGALPADSTAAVQHTDVVTTECGDTCPIYPAKRSQDWDLEDLAGPDLETVPGVRNQIKTRSEKLLTK